MVTQKNFYSKLTSYPCKVMGSVIKTPHVNGHLDNSKFMFIRVVVYLTIGCTIIEIIYP